MKDLDDDIILEKALDPRTKEQGFKLLMVKYQEPIYYHIRRMVGSHEDANDVIQDTFVKVYRNLEKFKGDSKLYSWLYRIATNESLTFISRRKKRLTIAYESDNEVQSKEADKYMDMKAGEKLLYEAIDLLPQKQKLVFNMKYFDAMSYADISEALTTSEGALKASFHHASKKIEQYIKSKMS